MIKGIDLVSQGQTKTVYMDRIDTGSNRVCVIDDDILTIEEISGDCSGAGEVSLVCDGSQQGNYRCSLVGSKYKIEGLSHSAAVEYTYVAPVINNGGGGGGGSSKKVIKNESVNETLKKIPLKTIIFPKKETKGVLEVEEIVEEEPEVYSVPLITGAAVEDTRDHFS